jgi:hypothetical protein
VRVFKRRGSIHRRDVIPALSTDAWNSSKLLPKLFFVRVFKWDDVSDGPELPLAAPNSATTCLIKTFFFRPDFITLRLFSCLSADTKDPSGISGIPPTAKNIPNLPENIRMTWNFVIMFG